MEMTLRPQGDVKWQGGDVLMQSGKLYHLFETKQGHYQYFDDIGQRVELQFKPLVGMTILNSHIYSELGMYDSVKIDVVAG